MPIVMELALTRVDPVMKMFEEGMFNMPDMTSRKHNLSCAVASEIPAAP
jgi:hypothetical protein